MVGAEPDDHVSFGRGRLGVVGDAPSHEEAGVVGQLPYPSAPGVADRFTGAEPAEFVEPFAQPAASGATRLNCSH